MPDLSLECVPGTGHEPRAASRARQQHQRRRGKLSVQLRHRYDSRQHPVSSNPFWYLSLAMSTGASFKFPGSTTAARQLSTFPSSCSYCSSRSATRLARRILHEVAQDGTIDAAPLPVSLRWTCASWRGAARTPFGTCTALTPGFQIGKAVHCALQQVFVSPPPQNVLRRRQFRGNQESSGLIRAGAGTGKSTVTAKLLAHVVERGSPAAAVHFIKHSDQRRLEPVNMIKSIAFQLAKR